MSFDLLLRALLYHYFNEKKDEKKIKYLICNFRSHKVFSTRFVLLGVLDLSRYFLIPVSEYHHKLYRCF